jgi:glycosyltransferase involved in cell wall biosynthesis
MANVPIRILMVSTEYPPMQGGVGRYTANLTKSLRKLGLEVSVVCNEKGEGDYLGLSPYNDDNSDVLSKAVQELKPDLVHIQNEPGLYGLVLDPINPTKTSSTIDSFYYDCKVPIVTTFHSAYTFKQWMNLSATWITERTTSMKRHAQLMISFWEHILNYHSFHDLNREKLLLSKGSIVFSNYLSRLIGGGKMGGNNGGCNVIYHGAEPSSQIPSRPTKKEARSKFSLPEDRRIALALGFMTTTKGWDILEKMNVPDDWVVVVNSSKNNYNKENFSLPFIGNSNKNNSIIDLQKEFLDDEDLTFLFYAADATILPYTVCSASGVMFDGLVHGLPFVASDLPFFREFASKGLGVAVKRRPDAFADGLSTLARDYETYSKTVNNFKAQLKWDEIAAQHALVYQRVLNKRGKPEVVSVMSPRFHHTRTTK